MIVAVFVARLAGGNGLVHDWDRESTKWEGLMLPLQHTLDLVGMCAMAWHGGARPVALSEGYTHSG